MTYCKFKALGKTLSVLVLGNQKITESLRDRVGEHLRKHNESGKRLSFCDMYDIQNGQLIKMIDLEIEYHKKVKKEADIICCSDKKIIGVWK